MKKLKQTLAWLLVLCMVTSFLPASVFAAAAEAPKTGLTTNGSPFQKGTGESNSFRIPALVTLSDGTLVAAADARWNTTYDGGGLDTMVAISKDNGATWTHSFANYLGDNGNQYNGASSCFIDPALAVLTKDENNDGTGEDTIYMLCDLYPNGVALNGSKQCNPSHMTGFNADGYLKLTTMEPGVDSDTYIDSDFTHYLNGEKIYANDGAVVEGLTVDAYFNVTGTYGDKEIDSNLFFADSPFHVARTGYLYLTKSTNGGETWSAPQLLNLKTNQEMVCLVGPGRGIVTYKGNQPCIVFPIYSYNGGDSSQRTGFIYSDDEGATWNRVDSNVSWSSESAVVDLLDGTLRFFYRNGSSQLKYVDYSWDGGWGEPQTTGIATNSNTQISAISPLKTIDDQQVILVSCPAGPDGGSNDSNATYRTNGKIFLFTVGENNVMTNQGEVSVPSVHSSNSFMYSCMTALIDNEANETGDIAILYEDQQSAWGNGYYQMSYKTFNVDDDFGVTTDVDSNVDIEGETPLESYEEDRSMKVGQTITETVEGIYVPSGSTKNDYVSVSWVGTEDSTSTTVTVTAKKVGETTVDLGNGAIQFDITIEKGASVDVQLKVNETKTYTDNSGNYENAEGNVDPDSSIATMTVTGTPGTTRETLVPVTTESFDPTKEYVIVNVRAATEGSGQAYRPEFSVLTPNQWGNGLDTSNFADVANGTRWTIDGSNGKYHIGSGDKVVTIGNVTASMINKPDDPQISLTYVPGTTEYNTGWLIYLDNGDADPNDGDYFLSDYNGASWREVVGYTQKTDPGNYWSIYEVQYVTDQPASTTVSFTGKAVGRTTAIVGETTYNITVLPETTGEPVNVELKVGESTTLTDTTGNHKNNVSLQPNADIATMTVTGTDAVTGTKTTKEITSTDGLVAGKEYIIVNERRDEYNQNHGLLTTETYTETISWSSLKITGLNIAEAASADTDYLWTITPSDDGTYAIKHGDKYLTLDYNSGAKTSTAGLTDTATYLKIEKNSNDYCWFIRNSENEYLSNIGRAAGYTGASGFNEDGGSHWKIYEIVDTSVAASTSITFEGVAIGTTTAVVGNTLYNITVTGENVDIELEIGESFTYTDTTGNYVDKVTQEPNGTYATMAVTGTSNSVVKKLELVTASTFQTGKRYVIENVRAADPDHDAYQPNYSVLTSTAATGGATGLVMNGPLNANSSQTWTFTPNDNMYYVGRDNSYITLDGSNAYMSTAAQSLSFEYVNGEGWLIYYNRDGNNTSNDGDYFLSDVGGNGRGEAFGYTTKGDDGNYWNIYEVVDEQQIDSTKVTFTGVADGETIAIVGNTQYNITVVPAEVDDEVMNSATDIWTVDPEVQRQRYNTIINGKYKDLYTDESWKQYEAARQKVYKKLVEVTNAKYDSKEKADAALAELKALVDALETAANQLVAATTISVRYRLDTADGTLLDTREYKIASTDTSVTLPETIVVDDIAYKVTDTTLELQGAETSYNVPVTLIGKVGEGFVGSQDIKPGELTYNDHSTVCDLVDNNGGKKITEMTVTVGISYNLDLGIEMLDGYTVEWLSDNTSVATVDQEGNVTAVGDGIANITATVKDAAGNIVEVNSIPVNVYPKGTGDRTVAVYIENIDNTTVWCVINANTSTYGFEVIEGELVYGQFDTTVSDGTKTTAMSFFGDPDEAHALVYMKSTNSDDHYFLLHDDEGNLYDGTDTPNANYYVSGTSGGAGWWQALGLNDNANNVDPTDPERWQIVKDMVQWAINLGCDGGLGFTRRQDGGALGSNLSFKSDPMPRIEKVVDGVLPTTRKQANYRRYVDDMVAAVHELVYFKITVTQEVPTEWQDANQTVGEIVYTNAWVKDTVLPGAYLYTKELDQDDGTWDGEISDGVDENGEPFRKQQIEITNQLNEVWTAEQKAAGKRVFEFYLMYEIQESDIPKFYIDNIANLDYNYDSHYSTGAQAAAADAEARISVVGSAIDNVVIDFGQSFTYQSHPYHNADGTLVYTFGGLTNSHLKGAYVDGEYDANGELNELNADGSKMVSGATAKYGDVKVYRTPTTNADGKPDYIYTVKYTPTAILQEADAVRIYGIGENGQKKLINGFLVYPATTVYYEEGFLEDVSSWNFDSAKKATTEQTFELLGVSQFDNHGTLTHYISNKKQAYGFDPIYDGIESDNNIEVAPSSISATTAGSAAKFTFTGTGFEIFANCTENSGYVLVTVKDKNGNNVKMFTVDTVVKGGDTGATSGQRNDMNALPIVSLKDLEHGTYTVTLMKVKNDGKAVIIDGVRITNTVSDSSIYTVDLEDSPEFYQLRDSVMNALDIDAETSEDYGDLTGKAQQVYNDLLGQYKDENGNTVTDTETPAAVITDVNGIYGDGASLQDLLDNGPKNEIYLWPNQTLTFKVATQRVIQVGLKAPSGATGFECTIRDDLTDTPAYVGGGVYGATDMFYYLTNKPVENINNTYVVSITNIGSSVLAITDLKVCDDPTAALVPLTLEDVTEILRDAGYTDDSEPEAPLPFEDVPADSYYHDPVAWAVKNGITNGLSETHFGPGAECNRAQAVTFLWRAAGSPEPVSGEHGFADVIPGSFYEKAVLWAVENGITNGTDATHFSPDLTCSRSQVVTFLYRAFNSPAVEDVENPFSDVPADAWYTAPVLWAVENGITNGTSSDLFDVNGVCNRAQIVTFLYRAYN